MPTTQELDQKAQDELQQIANEYHITITVTKPGLDPRKWKYTFCPPEPPRADHHDTPPTDLLAHSVPFSR